MAGQAKLPEIKDVTYQIEHKDNTEVELKVTVAPARFLATKDKVFNRLAPTTKIAGFRDGKAPKNLIEAKLGPRLFEETVNDILPEVTTEILLANEIQPLTSPHYHLEKVSDGDGVEFHTHFSVLPELKLPKFKDIKVTKETAKVEAKEVEDLFTKLKTDILQARKAAKDESEDIAKEIDWAKELQMEEVKDEAGVKQKLKDSLLQRKQDEMEDKYNTEIVKQAIAKAAIPAPLPLVERLLSSREKDYVSRIENLGLKLEDFLKAQKVDIDTLRKNWRSDAEFQIQSDLLFIEIAKAEGIKVVQEDIDAEIKNITDPESLKQYQTPEGRDYISSVLLRQKSLLKLRELVSGK